MGPLRHSAQKSRLRGRPEKRRHCDRQTASNDRLPVLGVRSGQAKLCTSTDQGNFRLPGGGSGLLVAVLGYCLRERLEELGIVVRQDWELEGRREYLVGLAATTVVLGFMCTLAGVLGILNLLLDLSAHIMLDIIFAVLTLAEVGVALASFMLRTWVRSDIPPKRADCEEDLRNAVIVTGKLLPTIGFLFLASAVAKQQIQDTKNAGQGAHETQHYGCGGQSHQVFSSPFQFPVLSYHAAKHFKSFSKAVPEHGHQQTASLRS
ncbi:uncharacterized protein LOC142578369 [Dermacentor variabilis]|uniref:uncharacterized protein LOC142578369 n=1 Tax=Dermacentor variabilis TaxID=34621 RepID=UPI003F5C8992